MKKRISALLLSVVLCLGLLSTTAFAAAGVTGTVDGDTTTLTVSGVTGRKLCALWGDEAHKKLLLLFYTEGDGSAMVTVPTLAEGEKYFVGVEDTDGDDLVYTFPGTPVPSNQHTITFNANGGSITGDVSTQVTNNEGKLTSLPTATRSSYTFNGWYTAASGGTKITLDTVFDKDATVYAQWTPASSGPSGPSGGGSGGSSSSSSNVSVKTAKNGSVSINPSSPSKGSTVTLTVKPNTGYVLDTIKVLDSKGAEIELTKADDNKYTFVMPSGKVTVDAQFVKEESKEPATPSTSEGFSDVPSTHWANTEITWASENGVMNGIGGGAFAPDRTVTRQQLWMVLGRLAGSNPADMAGARTWAIGNNISDGTNPGNPLTRQQLVAILYRYAQLMGYPTTGAAEISTFPDQTTVSAYAKDAMAWAVGNGIVTGTSDGRLNPGGTATRAQFAVIMYRFDQKFAK